MDKYKKLRDLFTVFNAGDGDDVYLGLESTYEFIGDSLSSPRTLHYYSGARSWYKKAKKEKRTTVTKPYAPFSSKSEKEWCVTIATPIYEHEKLLGVLGMDLHIGSILKAATAGMAFQNSFLFMTTQEGDIVYGQHEAFEVNKNILKEDILSEELKQQLPEIMEHTKQYITFSGHPYKDSPAKGAYVVFSEQEPISNWHIFLVVDKASIYEHVNTFLKWYAILGILTIFIITAVMTLAVKRLFAPVKNLILNLKNISEGEGDLTIRLPVKGNDEIALLSGYFNKTIKKIGSSIKAVGDNTDGMQHIGTELANNMNQTASAVHQIHANIDGVKQQTQTQAASVSETAATIEQIIKTIKQLNSSIENQAASVAESSASIEQMVENIAAITQTLNATDTAIKKLATATGEGKETIIGTTQVTQKIAEESGSLLEASGVIRAEGLIPRRSAS